MNENATRLLSYQDNRVELFIENKIATVHEVRANKYYLTPLDSIHPSILNKCRIYAPKLTTSQGWMILAFNAALTIINAILLIPQITLPWTHDVVIITSVYSLFAVSSHEMTHFMALRMCGRKTDRIGIKLNYLVFPSFYVRMNQSLLLARQERILVHVAGLFINNFSSLAAFVVNYFIFRSAEMYFALRIFFLGIVANSLPLLNSDGYRLLLSIRKIHELKRKRANTWWILLLKILSVAIAVWYGWDYLIILRHFLLQEGH